MAGVVRVGVVAREPVEAWWGIDIEKISCAETICHIGVIVVVEIKGSRSFAVEIPELLQMLISCEGICILSRIRVRFIIFFHKAFVVSGLVVFENTLQML